MRRFTVLKELSWVLDEPAFPETAATVREIRRGAGAEKGEARAGAVGGSKGRAGEVD